MRTETRPCLAKSPMPSITLRVYGLTPCQGQALNQKDAKGNRNRSRSDAIFDERGSGVADGLDVAAVGIERVRDVVDRTVPGPRPRRAVVAPGAPRRGSGPRPPGRERRRREALALELEAEARVTQGRLVEA